MPNDVEFVHSKSGGTFWKLELKCEQWLWTGSTFDCSEQPSFKKRRTLQYRSVQLFQMPGSLHWLACWRLNAQYQNKEVGRMGTKTEHYFWLNTINEIQLNISTSRLQFSPSALLKIKILKRCSGRVVHPSSITHGPFLWTFCPFG